MRRLLAVWLIALFSLTNLAAVDSYQVGRVVTPFVGSTYTCASLRSVQCRCRDQVVEETRSACVEILRSAQNDIKSDSISFEGYWELVRNTRQVLVEMDALPDNEVREGLDDLAAQWEKVTAVEFPDQSVAVDPSYLVAILKQDTPDLERLVSLMNALLRAHEAFPQKVFTVQDVEPLKEILARPEFQWTKAQAPQNPEWLQRILDFFDRIMTRLAHGVRNGVYYGRVPLIIAAVIVFFLSLFFIARNLSRNLVREAELAAENGEDDALLTSKGAMQRAQTLSSQGDYRTAVRYLYLSSLLILDEHGVLRYDRSRTNREYLRSVSSKPELAKPLSDVIDVFDRVWYGYDSVDDETYQSYVKHVDELREKKE